MEAFKAAVKARLSEIESEARETGNQVIHSKVFNEYHDKIKGLFLIIEEKITAINESEKQNKPDLSPFFISVSGLTIENVVKTVESVSNMVSVVSDSFVS